jgi:hypothetical protein
MKHNLDLVYKKYTEEELENNIHLFEFNDFRRIYTYQKLSEKFIEKHSTNVDWGYISHYQYLSEEFIKKHINKISIYYLMMNKKISKNIKQEIKTLKYII